MTDKRSRRVAVWAFFAMSVACASAVQAQNTLNYPVLGRIIRDDPRIDELIPPDAKIEVVTSNFLWVEGPVWVKDGGYILFSDIPNNRIMKWTPGKGVSLFMKPSGYTGVANYGHEPGSNGLMIDSQGRLVCCEHGDRRVSVLEKNGGKRTLADSYRGKRFNSPNDGVIHSNGDIYFTDPAFGLPQRYENDPRRELDFSGVYRVSKDGTVTLLTTEVNKPNGIGFSPDEKTLYVANSERESAIWKAFAVKDDGTLGPGRVFYDATYLVKPGVRGVPDGLKVDEKGNVYGTGPDGVHVIAPDGTHLGTIVTGEWTANCAWGEDGTVLYLAADMYLCRLKTNTKGMGW